MKNEFLPQNSIFVYTTFDCNYIFILPAKSCWAWIKIMYFAHKNTKSAANCWKKNRIIALFCKKFCLETQNSKNCYITISKYGLGYVAVYVLELWIFKTKTVVSITVESTAHALKDGSKIPTALDAL